MRATAIIPVKRFGAAKQRLADVLGTEPRAALTEAMLGDVLDGIAPSRRIEHVVVVTGEPAAERAARARGCEIVLDPVDEGHSEAARLGVSRALELRSVCAALLPGDCPLIAADEIDEALARMSPDGVAIVPDRHGTGTNALFLAPPRSIDPAFGQGSRARHEALARAAGLEVVLEPLSSLALDIDTPEDLAALGEAIRGRPQRAPRTAAALHELGVARNLI
jgi:2-phospho-L-lactate guanylyltransferase